MMQMQCKTTISQFNKSWCASTHSGGEKGACFELLKTHGGGVGTEEEDEGHEGDVWDVATRLSHQLSFVH